MAFVTAVGIVHSFQIYDGSFSIESRNRSLPSFYLNRHERSKPMTTNDVPELEQISRINVNSCSYS